MPPLFAEEADSTAGAPRFRARAGRFQMVSIDDGFLVIPISGAGPTLRAQVVAFHLETPRPAAWAPEAYAVAISPSGTAAYVLGATSGSSLPTPTPAAQQYFSGSEDLFVATFMVP